ncbi:MAG TPA: pyridoxal phosphate-dependent aminotransferase [Candidatus Obscuribacterales bacterium]
MGHTLRRLAGSARASAVRPSRILQFSRAVSNVAAGGGDIIDLALGYPDFPPPEVVQAVIRTFKPLPVAGAGADGPHGSFELRQAIASWLARSQGHVWSPEEEITISPGASEALTAALMVAVDPGDEVVLFEPFFDNYLSQIALSGAVPRLVRLQSPDWTFDPDDLSKVVGPRTRAIILNTPHNPTGRVFSANELEAVASLCRRWNVLAIADETYASLTLNGCRHVSIAALPGMACRSIVVGGFTKTLNVRGWRLGYVAARRALTARVRAVQPHLHGPAGAVVQAAALAGLRQPEALQIQLRERYERMARMLGSALSQGGFQFRDPQGTAFIFADGTMLERGNDLAVWRHLLRELGVAAVPGRCFYRTRTKTRYLRFCFARSEQTLEAAGRRLAGL